MEKTITERELIMILNRVGQVFEYEDKTYIVGEEIYSNNISEYKHLFGRITEIRTDEDRETENDTPDIYCAFERPALTSEYRKLCEAMSGIEDIAFDLVIMAPEMITPLRVLMPEEKKLKVFALIEDCTVDYQDADTLELFTDIEKAKLKMRKNISTERESGCIERWTRKSAFEEEETSENEYSAWISGTYCQDHYCTSIREIDLPLSQSFVKQMMQIALDEKYSHDFEMHVSQWDEMSALSDKDYNAFISDPTIVSRIGEKLKSKPEYAALYWEAISEVADDLWRNFIATDTDESSEGGEKQ